MAKSPGVTEDISTIEEVLDGRAVDMNAFKEWLFEQTVLSDRLFSDISDDAFDPNGYLYKDFEITTETVQNASTQIMSDLQGSIAIYADYIEDVFVNGGDSVENGGFILYSPVSNSQPTISSPERRGGGDDSSFQIRESNADGGGYYAHSEETEAFRYYHNYSSLERTAQHIKYACIPGITSIDVAPFKGLEYVNNMLEGLCLDVYNTVLTREFIPQRIRQRATIDALTQDTTLGEETQAADGDTLSTARIGY